VSRIDVSGNTMTGRTRWRDLGRPEAALVGAHYVGWSESHFPNHPYRVLDTRAARWLFAGTNLHSGSRLGRAGPDSRDQEDWGLTQYPLLTRGTSVEKRVAGIEPA
jgi:N,N-dimethylformamidase beta subunit-like, C-terminal